jgi:hypothetical protein
MTTKKTMTMTITKNKTMMTMEMIKESDDNAKNYD